MVNKWGNDNFGSNGWRTAAITDIDGSLGFGPNAYIVNDIGILRGIEACEPQPSWNAVVCQGDLGRMNVGSAGGGRGGFGGFGGGGFGGRGGGAPAEPPVVLSRNGIEFTATGQTSVVAGTEIKVATERDELSISLSQLDSGSWVIFELPGFTTAGGGSEKSSLEALRAASDTSYYQGDDALWVKVVAESTGGGGGGGGGGRGGRGGFGGFGGGTSLQVSR
jgi:cell migration-inducing and hyaluronan-binding protein